MSERPLPQTGTAQHAESNMTTPAITLLDRREIARNAVFTVFLDHIRDASGREVVDFLSVVPHQWAAERISGVAVLPVLVDQVGLIRVFRHPLGQFSWEAAKGFVDTGETPAAAAVRELSEETGWLVRESALRSHGVIAPEGGVIAARVELFLAPDCGGQITERSGEIGHREIVLFGRPELAQMIAQGNIIDPATLLLCLAYVNAQGGAAKS